MKSLCRNIVMTILPFFLVGTGLPTNASGGQTPANAGRSTSDQLLDIQRRISDLESTPRFEVVDKAGKVMFSVGPSGMRLYSAGQKLRAALLASGEGAIFGATNGSSLLLLRADEEGVGMTVEEGGQLRMTFGNELAKNYSLKFPVGKTRALAGIGESEAGSGALIVGDQDGQLKGEAGVINGNGTFTVYNGDGNGVALLTRSVNGGGLLDLTDPLGNTLVLMKTNENRYGVVSAFPPGLPYIPSSALPGTYLLGCAGGNKCRPYK
jgi:hypothetical protein